MAAVDPNYANWLKQEAFYRSWANGTLNSALLAMGIDSEVITPFAASAAADAELARQGAIYDGPLAMDAAVVPGRQGDLAGKCITLTCDLLNYSAGVTVLVIQAIEQDDATTQLYVLRAL